MKKVILTLIASAGLSASVLAQGTITADNLNGGGNNHAASLGLFFNPDGTPYTGAFLNLTLLGGADAGSLAPVATFVGAANGLVSFGGGQYADPLGLSYAVPGVALGGNATLRVLAWRGAAASFGQATSADQFNAWNGSALVPASGFTFINPTGGGGTPPGLPKSLDGMPAMSLVVPEPSTLALAGLGAAALLMYRRRKV